MDTFALFRLSPVRRLLPSGDFAVHARLDACLFIRVRVSQMKNQKRSKDGRRPEHFLQWMQKFNNRQRAERLVGFLLPTNNKMKDHDA